FGADIFTGACSPPVLRVPPLASGASRGPSIRVSWAGSAPFTVQVRKTSFGVGSWRTLLAGTARGALTFAGRYGQTYDFQVRSGAGPWTAATTVVPTTVSVPGGTFRGNWR